ncbi:MAG TPA: serine/threonine-protein kinase [Anaeromyxobacter sp.]|nr:serine/threonine-protein kinase [Anaeromyxobacter sp.]
MAWPFRSARPATTGRAPRAPGPRRGRWGFAEGAEIAPGRHVLGRLGGGSRYEVYLAWDEALFALVVAKILRPGAVGDARAREELRREASLVERLAHPCLVRGFGAVLDGAYPHVVLEHVEGPTLHRLVERSGPAAMEQLLPLALHVAAVLHHLAGRGVVHLDVKPANVVMSAPPRLIDLSVARSVEEARTLRVPIGTDAYMAPEQCLPGPDAPPIGPAADVWALGATLFHAAAGRPPFPRRPEAARSADAPTRFPQLVRAPEPLGDRVPAAVSELVRRMLARDPAARPSAREVVEALEPLVAAVPDRLARTRRGLLVPPR